MKKRIFAVLAAAVMVVGLFAGCSRSSETKDGENATKTVGFVTFGLGGDFFQMLADDFVATAEAAGWEASYQDGQFNPDEQIKACEDYIAQGVDAIVCWSVVPQAMGEVVAKCEAEGIKWIAFVAPTDSYDGLLITDNVELGDNCAKLAAKWIDETFADAPDHSVKVAVFYEGDAETGVEQGNELLKIDEFSTKAAKAIKVDCGAETTDEGQAQAENLFVTDPDVKVILTAHSPIATGVNAYLTSMGSPITDYSDMGIFCINGDDSIAELIKASINNESPLRGTVMTGSVHDTAVDIVDVLTGLVDGRYEKGYVSRAANTIIFADTVDEYLSNGKVTSFTPADL